MPLSAGSPNMSDCSPETLSQLSKLKMYGFMAWSCLLLETGSLERSWGGGRSVRRPSRNALPAQTLPGDPSTLSHIKGSCTEVAPRQLAAVQQIGSCYCVLQRKLGSQGSLAPARLLPLNPSRPTRSLIMRNARVPRGWPRA